MDILRFYYGEDIQVVQADGECVLPVDTTDGTASDLFDDRYDAFARAAADLTAVVAARCPGTVRAISVDFDRRVLLATFESEPRPGVVRIDDDSFDTEIRPLCRALRDANGPPPA